MFKPREAILARLKAKRGTTLELVRVEAVDSSDELHIFLGLDCICFIEDPAKKERAPTMDERIDALSRKMFPTHR